MGNEQSSTKEKYVTGLGGVFFRSKDPKALGLWYEKYFGINTIGNGEVWNQEAGPTAFSPFKENTEYFGRQTQMFMFNFRVNNLDLFLEYLQNEGVKIDSERYEDSIGKFAWVYDIEENKIELWEPGNKN